jgi:hypothetical protein
MAVNETRSLNAELTEGLTDGLVFKMNPNRSGTTADAEAVAAAQFAEMYIPWVREWSPTAMIKSQKWAENRARNLFG